MIEWKFDLTEEAKTDLEKLDYSIRIQVLKKIKWFRDKSLACLGLVKIEVK